MYGNDAEMEEWPLDREKRRVPSPVFLISIGFYMLIAYFAQLVEDEMPRVIKEADLSFDNPDQFSEELALKYLNILLGDYPRVAGTAYHLEKTKDLKQLVDSIVENSTIPVRTDWQFASSDYWLTFATPHVNRYVNVSNIIAVLEGESGFNADGSIGTSLLVNCHYDSVPFAKGASDNGAFCAVMVEVLHRLSRRQTKLKHNVVFLFNGAEENPLMGSHAFLQHEWSRNCYNVINLDASGMNGKPGMFQVTDPRLLKLYSKVTRRPNAQGLGEFLFASGVVPSDTDFRIFRDFGQIYGVDIAFTKYGVVYHTPYDNPTLLKEGVLQNAGEMLLDFVALAADQTSVEKEEPTTAVYYDYMNWFTVSYSVNAAIAVDLLCSLAGFLSVFYYLWIVGFSRSSICELLWGCLGRLLCTVIGIVVCLGLALTGVAITIQLRYLAHPWSVGAWWSIYVVAAVATSHLFDAWRSRKGSRTKTKFSFQSTIPRSLRVYQASAATRLILSMTLFIMSLIPSLVSVRYLFTVLVLMTSVTSVISMTMYKTLKLQGWRHLTLDTVLSLPSLFFVFALSLRLNAFLLPIMGRSASSHPDYIVAAMNTGLVALTATTVSGMELLFSRKRLVYVLSLLLLVSTIITFIPLFPYQDDGPATQRHYWFHSQIITYDRNGVETNRSAGLVVTKNDALTFDYVLPALQEHNITYNYTQGFAEDCELFITCNLPLYRAKYAQFLKNALMLYTGPPAEFSPVSGVNLLSRNCVGDNCTLQFRMIGTPHNSLTFWPVPGVNLTSWSYNATLLPTFEHENLPVYLIIHSEATYSGEGCYDDFTLNLTVPVEQQSQTIIEIGHHAHKIYHPEDFTEEYKQILDAMPKYFSISSNLSIRKNYEF